MMFRRMSSIFMVVALTAVLFIASWVIGPAVQRTLQQDAAQYEARAAGNLVQRALEAEAARYSGLAKFYLAENKSGAQQAIEANAARYSGLAGYYLARDEANQQRAIATEAARYYGLAKFYLTENKSGDHAELARVRTATAKFHRVEVARQDGYDPRDGLDQCFDNPGVGGMGVHYIKTDILDLTLDALQPEAMVYVPGPKGQLNLGAVEYIVPADKWEEAGHTEPPTVLGHQLHLDSDLGMYVLHAWLWRHNPAGIFEDWNPKVSCP